MKLYPDEALPKNLHSESQATKSFII